MLEIINVVVAGIAAYGFGAVWYMSMAKRWMAASGVPVGEDGQPRNARDPKPYITSLVSMLAVATMMHHMFARAGIVTPSAGLTAGLGIGLFIVFPWIATHYTFADRDKNLIWLDGVYNLGGCAIIGLVLTLF